ncbi:YdcF family protein [Cyanobium sp. A1C-AMD]|uniref:YdcF family protein n=1 Tax=Cyanobium sp. A1C-AMD TaxID=2823694 RepID=UPI0020CF09C9|nr:YdcF family protein [Cyanobium sp. A1C-AMD]
MLGSSAAGFWLVCPWIVPFPSPVPTSTAGSDVVVVLDGGPGRFAAADRIGHALPQPTPEQLQGFDTATQITALAHWLRHQPSPRSARVWIATDPDHTARAVILARIALGSQGIRVGPADWPTPRSAERRKLLRDALRLTLWRATGSTGAWLAPQVVASKRADCGV